MKFFTTGFIGILGKTKETWRAYKKKQDDKVKNDYKEMKEKYPKVDVMGLIQDETFKAFSKSRIENESLLSIYEDYKVFKKSVVEAYKLEQEEKRKKEQVMKRKCSHSNPYMKI